MAIPDIGGMVSGLITVIHNSWILMAMISEMFVMIRPAVEVVEKQPVNWNAD
jgi:hypothetical protein